MALTIDEAVNKGPGRPVNPWEHRAEVLRALRYVDGVIRSVHSADAIREMKPSVFVKGVDYFDQTPENKKRNEEACKEVGAELVITHSKKFSSTEILEKWTTSRSL